MRWHSVAIVSTSRTRSGAPPTPPPSADSVGSDGSTSQPGSGGRSQTAAPCELFTAVSTGNATAVSTDVAARGVRRGEHGGPCASRECRATGGSGASMRPPSPIALRSSARAPHSSQSSSPGSSSALPAATRIRIRSARTATGEPGPRCRSAAYPASTGASSTSKRSPVGRSRECRARSASPVRSRTNAGPRDSRGSGGVSRPGGSCRAGRRGEGTVGTMQGQPPERRSSYAGWLRVCAECPKSGRSEAVRGARMFAHSGGNRCVRHGVSVRTGKTSLVGGATRKARASHVRHRRTDGGGICLACGNIVSHHQVGADVGVRGQEAKDGVGSWNERSPLAGLSCGRTGRGASPYCLTALRSD
jgi:hypothetical protein